MHAASTIGDLAKTENESGLCSTATIVKGLESVRPRFEPYEKAIRDCPLSTVRLTGLLQYSAQKMKEL
jgi:hypothetical protein